ncbi:MAG: hypothetical protein Q8N08_07790 [Methanobacteriaceae archaeon]|nr:hypothetical protein [Methanobacteriaceae archaeon]
MSLYDRESKEYQQECEDRGIDFFNSKIHKIYIDALILLIELEGSSKYSWKIKNGKSFLCNVDNKTQLPIIVLDEGL